MSASPRNKTSRAASPCPLCAEVVPPRAEACPGCGASVVPAEAKAEFAPAPDLGAAGVGGLAGAVAGFALGVLTGGQAWLAILGGVGGFAAVRALARD